MFEYDPTEMKQLTGIWQLLTEPIKAVLVSKNPVWMSRNVIKDYLTTVKNIPEVRLRDAPKLGTLYRKAFKEAWADVMKGERSEDIKTLMLNKALVADRAYNVHDESYEHELERQGTEFNIDVTSAKRATAAQSRLKRTAKAFWNWMGKLGRISDITGKIAGYKYLKKYSTRPEHEMFRLVRDRIGTPNSKRQGASHILTNNIYMFSNIGKEGIRAAIESFKEDKSAYVFKTLAINVVPKLMLRTIGTGLALEVLRNMGASDDDDTVKYLKFTQRILMGVSEYDRSHYNIIPLGLTKEGKSIFLRIPEDYEGQFWGSLVNKMVEKRWSGTKGIPNLIYEQSPYKFHPLISAVTDLIQYYARGQMPIDGFRGRQILSRDEYAAGGMAAAKRMFMHTWDEVGLGTIYRFSDEIYSLGKSDWERALSTGPGQLLGTFLKISDRGIGERAMDKIMKIRKGEAKERIAANTKMNEFIKTLTPEQANILLRGKKVPQKLKTKLIKGYGSSVVKALASAKNNTERLAVIEVMTEMEKLKIK